MMIYCMSRRELLKEISSWTAQLEEDKELEIKIHRDVSIEKTYILDIFEKDKEKNGT